MSYLDHRLGRFLDLVAEREPAPGGGSVAAVTVSLAAGLVSMTARYSADRLPQPDLLIADSERLRRRAAALADADADAYRAVLDAGGLPERIRAALTRASLVPLEVAELGAETARLAARLVDVGNPHLRGDAATALCLAEAAVRSAAQLVAINVRSGGCDEELVRRAARSAEVAADARQRLNAD